MQLDSDHGYGDSDWESLSEEEQHGDSEENSLDMKEQDIAALSFTFADKLEEKCSQMSKALYVREHKTSPHQRSLDDRARCIKVPSYLVQRVASQSKTTKSPIQTKSTKAKLHISTAILGQAKLHRALAVMQKEQKDSKSSNGARASRSISTFCNVQCTQLQARLISEQNKLEPSHGHLIMLHTLADMFAAQSLTGNH